jgi:hypothetical protein
LNCAGIRARNILGHDHDLLLNPVDPSELLSGKANPAAGFEDDAGAICAWQSEASAKTLTRMRRGGDELGSGRGF